MTTSRWFRKRPGINLIEVVVAAAMAGVVFLALGGFIVGTFKANAKESDVAFAMQKATQLMEELSSINTKDPSDPGPDRYADGPHFELTITTGIAPNSALSGNPLVKGSRYKYVRAVYSTPVVGDPLARQVTVKVWLNDGSATPGIPSTDPLATLTNVLRSNIAAVAPKQVVDVWIISIENLPHLVMKDSGTQYYTSAPAALGQFNAALTRLQSKYPGVEFRRRVITRLSEGRDRFYRPYINKVKGLDKGSPGGQQALNWAYLLPGAVKDPAEAKYFDFATTSGGYLLGDTVETKVDGSYPLADQFNHAVRHGVEISDTGAATIPAGYSPSGDVSPLSLRQFLESLLTDTTGKYQNALVVNLHGALFPALPLRNYSDAAMDPADTDPDKRKRRLVTHPLKLVTPVTPAINSELVHLLVHPYMSDGADTPRPGSGNDREVQTSWDRTEHASEARVIIKGLRGYIDDSPFTLTGVVNGTADNTAALTDIRVQSIERLRETNSSTATSMERVNQWPPALGTGLATDVELTVWDEKGSRRGHSGPHATSHSSGTCHGAWAGGSVSHGTDPVLQGDDVVITLSDLDYDAHRVTPDSGASYWGFDTSSSDRKLYGLQYFPDPFLPLLNVASKTGTYDNRPRNTARAIISFKLKASAAGRRFEVQTQLRKFKFGVPAGEWPLSDADAAVSRTWFYAGDAVVNAWDNTKELYKDVPLTDQFQLTGDPRHMPYLDGRLRKLYNPYWSDFKTSNPVYKDVDNSSMSDPSKVAGPNNVLIPAADVIPGGTAGANTEYPGSAISWLGAKYNAPAYFRIWREALLKNGIVFVNVGSAPMSVLAMGGEFSLDNAVNGILDVKIAMKPWDGSSGDDAGGLGDELFNTSEGNTVIEKSDDSWFSKPWIGQLFPAAEWANWRDKGNLPSATFFRRSIEAVAWDVVASNTKTENHRYVGSTAFGLFLNAVKSGDATPFNLAYGSTDDTAPLSLMGKTVATNLGMNLPASLKGPYSYKLTGGAPAPGWTAAPDNRTANRLQMNWINTAPSNGPGYYNAKTAGEYTVAPIYIQGSTIDLRKAVIVPVVVRPDSVTRFPSIMDVAATAGVAAYFDASNNALGAFNTKPLPRVKITAPLKNQTIIDNSANIQIYAKYTRSTGDPLSPLYPSDLHSPPVNPTLGDPYDVQFFVKYWQEPSGPWRSATLTGPVAVATNMPFPTALPTDLAAIPPMAHTPGFPTPVNVSWNTTALPNGDYKIRVEAFRVNGGINGGKPMEGNYSYHEIPVSIQR